MVEIYVLRHGETFANLENKICGKNNVRLTDNGKMQAKLVGSKLKNLNITKILTSPLDRAIETAEIVSNFIELSYEVDHRLTEFDFGIYDGEVITEEFIEKRNNFAYKFEQGESILLAASRVFPLLLELDENKGETCLLITHNAISRVINSYYNNVSNSEFFSFNLNNCELIKLK